MWHHVSILKVLWFCSTGKDNFLLNCDVLKMSETSLMFSRKTVLQNRVCCCWFWFTWKLLLLHYAFLYSGHQNDAMLHEQLLHFIERYSQAHAEEIKIQWMVKTDLYNKTRWSLSSDWCLLDNMLQWLMEMESKIDLQLRTLHVDIYATLWGG